MSAAARDLNVTHAAIGQHVRALEDHFGLSLMQRDGRGMLVTPDGQKLAITLSDAFGLISSASTDLLDQSKTRAIRVAVPCGQLAHASHRQFLGKTPRNRY